MKTAAKGSPFARAGAPARRLLSALLALVMLLGLVPLWALPARAASGTGVDYDPKYPEVAILNRYTGNNDAFYKKLLVDTTDTSNPYRFYNGITLFGHNYNDRATGNTTWDFYFASDSVLKKLVNVSKNLEVNASATFYNRTHTHTDFDWSTFKNWEVQITSFHSMSIGVAGCYSYPILGGNKDTSRKYPRIGNPGDGTGGGYKTLTYFNDYCRLHFYPSVHQWTDFKERECTCGGTYAEKVLVTFRDTRTPQLVDMKYRINDGEYYDHNKGAYVGAGSTVYIKLIYDEPIRFYDDNAQNKDQLYLGLQVDRGTTAYQAKLVELKDNYMVFSYTLPDSQTTSVEIAAIDMSSLFPPAPLEDMMQVGPEGGFSITDQTGEGFTTSSCYITDLAGNPLRQETIPSPSLTLDGQISFVEKVEFHLETNNADVKEALGKAGKGPGTPEYDETSYADKSDTHLGVGDSFYLSVYMNERLTGIEMTPREGKKNSYYIDWQHAVFTTNIKDAGGQYVTVRSAYFYPFYDYDKSPTQFVTERVTIREGWTLEGETIQITGMEFKKKDGEKGELNTVTDLAGNPLVMDDVDTIGAKQDGQQFLDVTPPTVTVDGGYAPEGTGFRYGVKLDDNKSGYEALNGSFILNNNGDGKAYAYEWAVTMDPETTEKTKWTDGVTGVAYPFEQTGTVYFHIRPKTGETYADFSNCTITVKARDYAGNVGDVTLPRTGESVIGWYIDNLPPTVAAGDVSRKLNDDNTGTLTVNVTLSDSQGISAWQYAWSDSATVAPAADDSAWKDGGLVGGVVSPVTETVQSGTEFSGYLWVKAKDASGNANESAAACLGWYSYDLTAAKYALEYSSDITSRVALRVVSIADGDCLYFLLPLDNTGTRYAAALRAGYSIDNISNMEPWYSCTLTEANGIYTLTKDDQDADADKLLADIRDGTFKGTLSVKVLAGKHDALTGNEGNTVITLGNEQYHFTEETITLRVSGKNPESNYEGGFTLTADNLAQKVAQNASGLLSTLENLSFTVTIGKDLLGWKHEDIDWQSSYILLFNETLASGAEGKETQYFLGPIGNTNDKVEQTIVIGKEPSATGRYLVQLYIAFRSGGSVTETLGQKIYVDATRPDDDFQFQPIVYRPLVDYSSLNPYGLKDYYGIEGVKEIDKNASGVYILPIYGYGEYNFIKSTNAVNYYDISVKCEESRTPGYFGGADYNIHYGKFDIVLWNTAYPGEKITLNKDGSTTQQEFTNDVAGLEATNSVGFVFDRTAVMTNRSIYLEPGEVNTVAIQKVYANGAVSSVKYVRIQPVSDGVDGTAKAENGKLVFTPEDGAVTTGLKVFAWAYQNENAYDNPLGQQKYLENSYWNGKGQRIELTTQGDGTWTADLLPDGAIYRIFTESANGTLCESARVAQRAPWFYDMDQYGQRNDGYGSEFKIENNGDGTYTMIFNVRDDRDTMKDGLKFNIGLTFKGANGEEYAADYGFTYTWDDNSDYSWSAAGVEPSGIYSITTIKNAFEYNNTYNKDVGRRDERDVLRVTVTGVYPKGYDTMDVTVTATDAFGNTGTAKSENNTVSYVEPKAITSGEHAPVMDGGGLAISFTQPVRPVESWAWHEKDGEGFRTYWDGGAFPIPGNGEWDIQFRDIFGNVYVREITTDAFTTASGEDLSIDLDFSTTDVTKDPVILTTNAAFGVIRVWEQKNSGETTLPDLNNLHAAQKRQTKFEANAEVRVRLYDDSSDGSATRLSLRVYIDNIVSGAPAAEVHYYVEQLGQEFTQEELDDYAKNGATITGNVRAWYTTSRRVTPIEDTVSEFVFTPSGVVTFYTFKYVDDLGQTGSVTAKLPDGLTLNAPATPVPDTTAPDVSVDVYVKRGGAYTLAASFLPGDDIAAKLDALGYVQEYSLTTHASDASGFDITATGEGTDLTGNVLTITKPGKDVTITVTDGAGNPVEISFTVPAKIDNQKPTVTYEDMSNCGLYEKLLTLEFADYDDSKNETNTVFPVLPSGMVKDSSGKRFTYKVTENGIVHIIFRDMAGNVWEHKYTVTDIDTNPPELTTRWSPSETKDAATPPKGPVNTNVTAHIDSDKAMSGLTVEINGVTTKLLEDGKWVYTLGKEYIITGQHSAVLATISATPERVTVTYFQDYNQKMTFTATAPNGRSTTAVLNGPDGVIDKDAPQIDKTQDELCRKGFTVPYAVKVTLLPNEKVTSPNYGGWRDHEVTDSEGNVVGTVRRPDTYQPGTPGSEVDPEVPLVLTFTANGTYNVRFVDEAGNMTVHTVTIDSIDNTAPKLEVKNLKVNGKTATVDITVDEPCTVTWGKDDPEPFGQGGGTKNITLGENGTYLFVATDKAGNKTVQSLKVRDIDNIAPSISFDYGTIYVLKDDQDALNKQLNSGYTVWDNVTENVAAPTVIHDGDTEVTIGTAGEYTVTYTVTDAAGNVTTATRIVRVIGEDTVCLRVDGKLILPDSTAVLRPGAPHTLELANNTEPYTIKARAGVLSAGQMKYLSGSSLTFGAGGTFTVTTPGYYTLLVTTQSRQTIRILLYVER